MPLRFGIWLDFRNPGRWHRDPVTLYSETLELAVHAEALGFDDIWTSEHHFVEDGYLSSSLVTCAAIAARTKRVRVGTNVLLLPLHDPLRVAEDAATVDLLSSGRLDLGVAVGYRATEYATFGVDRPTRGARMDEAVQVIRGLLSSAQFDFDGRFYRLPPTALSPRPIQQPFPVLVGALSKVAARRAGRFGTGLLGPELLARSLDEETSAHETVAEYLTELRSAQPDLVPDIALGPGFGFVSDDPDRDAQWIIPHLAYRRRLYAAWFTGAGLVSQPTSETADEASFRERFPCILTSPDDARARVLAILEQFPATTRTFFWAVPPGAPVRRSVRSLELFAQHVIRPLRESWSAGSAE